MEHRGIRALRPAGIGLAVLLGLSTLAPLSAQAAPADHLTTLTGQVRARDGHPLAGIRVSAGPYEVSDPHDLRTVTTSAHGRYRISIPAGTALFMKFEDPKGRYFSATKDRFAARAGTSHRVNRVLAKVSRIAGEVRDEAGAPIRHAVVRAYVASTGARSTRTAMTDGHGRYRLEIEGGKYKIRFSHAPQHAEWFGDARTRKASPTVVVADGGTRRGIDAVLG